VTKSTVDQIRERFDNSVERFSNLETGNVAQVDSALSLELIAGSVAATNPAARSLLDIGCGAGNYTLRVLHELPDRDVTLIDLSQPMLERARQRISQISQGRINLIQGDIRQVDIGLEAYDVILAAAVLHHLRGDDEWTAVFRKLYQALRPGGTLWIYDIVQQTLPELDSLMMQRFAAYLVQVKGEAYRNEVFGWIEQEDTPRPLVFQLDTLRAVGFRELDILHKNTCFAAFGARK
jgi:tRNA (cmo5U34)-methyltransferase